MTPDEMIAVIQAFKDGKQIQSAYKGKDDWEHVVDPTWDFNHCKYRVEPELKTGWINVYPGDSENMAYVSSPHSTESEALTRKSSRCLATIKIQWPE